MLSKGGGLTGSQWVGELALSSLKPEATRLNLNINYVGDGHATCKVRNVLKVKASAHDGFYYNLKVCHSFSTHIGT